MSEVIPEQEIRVGLHGELDRQVSDYIGYGYHDFLDETQEEFSARFSELRRVLMEVSYRVPSDLAALVVIPESLVSLESQLELSGNRAFLRSSEMRSVRIWPREPKKPYALLDVFYGESLRNVSADEARETLAALGRTGLRLIELLNLGIHDRAAFGGVRGLYAIETQHEMEGFEPTVVDMYRYGHNLKVKRDPGNISDPDWTTPSYASSLIIG